MLAKKVAIDLGTVNTLVYVPGKGIVINEPSVVALNLDNDEVVAIGQLAEEMLGRTPESLVAYRPLRDGVIADFSVTRDMIKHYINQAIGRIRFLKPDVMVCIPAGATSTERKAVIDATLAAGARAAYLIQEPVAAALGAGIPITEPAGNMVIDIGGGTTEIAVISLGGVVAKNSIRVGGDKLDNAITEHLRRTYSLAVGEQTAEEIKVKIGSALPLDKELEMEVHGRDIIGGLPKTVTVGSQEITDALNDVLERITAAIRVVLERTPPELVSDIVDRGIMLTGGGALLRNLDNLLAKVINVPVVVAESPLESVAIGTGLALQQLREYQKSLLNT